jgi:soluble lytic murein transglycosylase
MGDWAGARSLFSRALVLTTEPAEVAAAHLWIGKCQEAQGDISAALDSWKIAQTADPFGHYSIRAEDLLVGRAPFSDPKAYTLDPDLAPYRMEAESWLRMTFNLAPDENLESPGLLAQDPRFQRGLEHWALGNYAAGREEFEALRQDLSGDPAQTFRLIPSLVEIGLYRSALAASTDLLGSAGLEGAAALEAPEFFSRVRFGAYYLDWVLPIADAEGLSPLLLLSVIRQESSYEGFIDSSAGARGLMQILPSTGAQLATDLEWPENYTVEDLYRPYVSLVFGANYLHRQRGLFKGDPFAMLAAYNGGPGNTLAWKGLTPIDDPDLFLEVIRIEETRNYIRLINEIHAVYRWLYGEMVE